MNEALKFDLANSRGPAVPTRFSAGSLESSLAQAPSFLQLSEDVGSLDPERVFGDLNLDVCTLEFNEHPVYMDDYTYNYISMYIYIYVY